MAMATSHSDLKDEWEILRKTMLIAASMTQYLENDATSFNSMPRPPKPTQPSLESSIAPLALPFPHDILLPISSLNIPDTVRGHLLRSFHMRINELQDHYTTSYKRACLESLQQTNLNCDLTAIHRAYQALYQRHCLPMFISRVSFTVAEVAKYQQPDLYESKRPFNTEFTHVLEKYFEYNGYPSSGHRTILARKTHMTPRQIQVWFQNHRSRAKKEGKPVQLLDSDIPLKRAFEVLPKEFHTSKSGMLTPPDDETVTVNSITTTTTQLPKRQKLASCLEETSKTHQNDLIRPPHAFPQTRENCDTDPFPTNSLFRFPSPIWQRKPATDPIVPTEVDMDDFAQQFHIKLTFANTSYKRESTPLKSEPQPFAPWYAPSRTIPPSAPLPALQPVPHALAQASTSILSSVAMDPFTFQFDPKPVESEETRVSCVVRLPFGPYQSASAITERIDHSAEALDRQRQVYRIPRRALNSPSPSTPRLARPGDVTGRKGSSTSRRTPSSLRTLGSRTSSFSSDISSSSDDSSSPPTPSPLPDQELFSDLLVDTNDSTVNYDNYFDFSASQPFNFSFTKPTDDIQPSALFQNHSPLIFA